MDELDVRPINKRQPMRSLLKSLGFRRSPSKSRSDTLGFAQLAFKDVSDTFLRSVHIEETYRHLMVGRPSRSVNEHRLQQSRERAKAMRPGLPVLMIPCSEQHIRHPAIDVPGLRVPPRDEFRLPRLLLIGELECIRTKTPDTHLSTLTVIWLQDSPLPLFAPEVLTQIRSYCWFDHAVDIDLS